MQKHLLEELLPYWRNRGVDMGFGGFLTYYDKDGKPTGETDKTLLAQARMIFTFSTIANCGHDPDGYFAGEAARGAQFVRDHFWDPDNEGWFWICDRHGKPIDDKKLAYGHSFMIHALSELALTGKSDWALEWAEKTWETFTLRAADNTNGGYWEFFRRDWSPTLPGPYGGDRKSLDVHMHLMEAFTNLYKASGKQQHKRAAVGVLQLIMGKMLHQPSGTGIAQFAGDFTPLRAILFKNVWGSDRNVDDPDGRPLDNSSYGHNVELGWLLNRSVEVLNLDPTDYLPAIQKLYDHCLEFGIDWRRGGVYCEGPTCGPARERNKEFWQQAEALVAMLDGLQHTGAQRYLDGYRNVHRFVQDHVVNHRVGEWYALLDESNNVVWDYLGHAWKINYHTVRSMLECEARLKRLAG